MSTEVTKTNPAVAAETTVGKAPAAKAAKTAEKSKEAKAAPAC